MPVNARNVATRVIRRIRDSEYRVTVVYPVVKAKPTGMPMASLPAGALQAKPNPQVETGEEPERVQSDVTMPCLFTDASLLGEYRQRRVEAEIGGWSRETTALLRVVASDATSPEGGTVFDGCAYVEVEGRRYKVLSVVPQGASTARPGTFYVLLTGAAKS